MIMAFGLPGHCKTDRKITAIFPSRLAFPTGMKKQSDPPTRQRRLAIEWSAPILTPARRPPQGYHD
jgi:hypothetical protein